MAMLSINLPLTAAMLNRLNAEYERGYAQARADAAGVCQEWRGHYPTDIFPDGDTPEAKAAKMARRVCSEIQFDIQQLEPPA